jgi:HAMP domain-containing protein
VTVVAERISRKALLTAAGVATGGVIAAAVLGSRERPRAELADRITARRIDGEVPALDPRDERWLDSTPVLVPLVPQQIALPRLDELGVAEVEVAALHNGDELGLRVIWDDQVVDEVDGLGQFRDALAVQLPALRSGEPPPITMGAPGTPVHILQWRATWERDIDDRAEVEDVYPYAVHDVPPDDILPPEQAILYYPGRAAGNPLSELDRRTSIEEIVAEGFGSVTVLPEQHARGFGVRDGDRWMVAVGLRLVRGASGDTLVPGSVWPVSFAVWLGDRGNRGSRKQYADWVELELEA